MYSLGVREFGGDDSVSALGDWLKQLILIVMVSIVAEMLLPTKATEKYVRAVLGVAVIAAMVSPIVPLLKGISNQQLANTVTSRLFDSSSGSPLSNNALERSYQDTLDHEEVTTADTMVAASLRESLPPSVQSHVKAIQVTSALTPSNMLVHVMLDGGGKTIVDQVTANISENLQIDPNQVIVTVDGGI